MTPRKKRQRYMQAAIEIAKEKGLAMPYNDWDAAWAILDEYGRKEFLYAIADRKNRLVKFGKSVNPSWRLKTLKTGNGMDLLLCGYCPNQGELSEPAVHKALAEHRVAGEWFRLNEATEAVIARIQVASGWRPA